MPPSNVSERVTFEWFMSLDDAGRVLSDPAASLITIRLAAPPVLIQQFTQLYVADWRENPITRLLSGRVKCQMQFF